MLGRNYVLLLMLFKCCKYCMGLQAKKMHVESLRSNQQQNQTSTEIRIAKAAISICFLFVLSWTPYAVMALIGAFGNQYVLM